MTEDAPEPDRIEGAPHPRATARLFGHEAVEEAFLQAYTSGRLHHAWLIAGPGGIGKATLAWRIARFLLATPAQEDGATHSFQLIQCLLKSSLKQRCTWEQTLKALQVVECLDGRRCQMVQEGIRVLGLVDASPRAVVLQSIGPVPAKQRHSHPIRQEAKEGENPRVVLGVHKEKWVPGADEELSIADGIGEGHKLEGDGEARSGARCRCTRIPSEATPGRDWHFPESHVSMNPCTLATVVFVTRRSGLSSPEDLAPGRPPSWSSSAWPSAATFGCSLNRPEFCSVEDSHGMTHW